MIKRKTFKKSKISEDERWILHKKLKEDGKILEADKLKKEILNSYIWKKPCHHIAGEVV
jgi:hypothetical protein